METQITPQESKQNNTFTYILMVAVVILLGYIGYIYTSHDMVKKGTLKSNYVLKDAIEFDMLPPYIKDKYIEYYDYSEKINELNHKLAIMKNKANDVSEPKIIEKIVEVPVEKIVEVPVEKIVKVPVEKIVEVAKIMTVPITVQPDNDNINLKETKYNTFTCKDLEEGSIVITKSCVKQLQNFLDENKDAKKFEVIGMVDNTEFKFINKLKDVYGAKKVKNLSKYSQIGLSRQRVIEASWVVREYIGDYKNIKTVNYTINTTNKKGFVVRAYK